MMRIARIKKEIENKDKPKTTDDEPQAPSSQAIMNQQTGMNASSQENPRENENFKKFNGASPKPKSSQLES